MFCPALHHTVTWPEPNTLVVENELQLTTYKADVINALGRMKRDLGALLKTRQMPSCFPRGQVRQLTTGYGEIG